MTLDASEKSPVGAAKTYVKAAAINPLKMSQTLGASYAFLGMNRCMPVMHGSQGCTSFGLVLLVRHFREAIPLQTTAMNEATTILGGYENLEKGILNIRERAKPDLIAICSTGLTETKGEDVRGHLNLIRRNHPEVKDTVLVFVSTPDFTGAFQDGWSKAVTALIDALVEPLPGHALVPNQINVLPGCHLSPGDLEELRELIESFGLNPIFLPDVSGSLDGHMSDAFSPTTTGGTTLSQARAMGASVHTLVCGESMRPCAEALEKKIGTPFTVLPRLTGLTAVDALTAELMRLSGRTAPAKCRKQRSQLQDAMLDAHFFFGGRRVAIGAEPDLLYALTMLLSEMGAEVVAAVTTTQSPLLAKIPAGEVIIGDLEDLEKRAAGCDLLITHSHGRQAAARLGIPLLRIGLPLFDRLGAGNRSIVGYRGTRDLLFEIGNIFLDHPHENTSTTWPLPQATLDRLAALAPAGAVSRSDFPPENHPDGKVLP